MGQPKISRRRFNQTALLGTVGAALGGCRQDGDSDPTTERVPRGIVLITADDLGWKDLSSYGLAGVSTPNIDRIVDEGVAFDRAFDVVSTCSSSRASIATGQYPHTHGVTGLVHRNPELSLPPTWPTLVRALSDAGFATAIQGKWHLSAEEQPEAFGYDTYLDTPLDQVIRSSERAIDFLEDHQEEPFFLELNYMQTHRDLFGAFPQAEGFEVSTEVAAPPAWWGLPDWPEIREEVAGYLSQLRWMDHLIGEVLDALDGLGLTDDTLVAFISDNGPPFPGLKLTLYDRGTGTPLALRWPSGLPAARHDELISSIDLAPTLLDLVGVSGLPEAQGRSLSGLLRGDADWVSADAIFAEMEQHGGGEGKPTRVIRTEQFKYIRNLNDSPWGNSGASGTWPDEVAALPEQTFDEPRPPEELFDLLADPLERVNLVDDAAHAATLADLRTRLDAHLESTDDFRFGE